MSEGILVIFSGPSGSGKGTVLKKYLASQEDARVSVSMTTRQPREGDIDGVHYYFVTREYFEKKIADGKMLEYAEYNHNMYGTPKEPVDEMLREGKIVFLEIEVQGAEKIRKLTDAEVLVGSLDITLYGADHKLLDRFPILNGTDIPFPIEDIPLILIDDILYTGKTIYKAINALLDIAEPSEIQLAAFLDRGRRSFPISADYVGARVPSSSLERVVLHMNEIDGKDEVIIEKRSF